VDTAYDKKIFPYAVRPMTHPARLGALARLMGREAAPPRSCRVLEIGAGDGVNLIAMAQGAPQSEFVGVDSSSRAVALGERLVAETGVANVRLLCADLRSFEAEEASFDYIVAHGVYAWAPPDARDALLALCGRLLSPRGVALINYNALPGCRLREAVRDILIDAAAGVEDPDERLAQGRSALEFYAGSLSGEDPFSVALAAEARRALARDGGTLFHDELGEVFEPQLFSQVVASARRHGLDYLCDASRKFVGPALFEEEIWRRCLPVSGGDFLRFEQARDFVELTKFRTSLFCRAGAPIERRFDPARMDGLHVDGALTPFSDPAGTAGAFSFKTPLGGEIATADAGFASVLERLGALYPAAARVDELADSPRIKEGLARLFVASAVGITTEPFPVRRDYGATPRINSLARAQAALGAQNVATLRHMELGLEDDVVRRFVGLVDGTRTVDELARDMARGGEFDFAEARERVLESLAEYAICGLIEA
jgi:SAM-dependent methyltransferase